jgi:hypothetical protein
MYVASILCGCYKSRSGCSIYACCKLCFKCFICMLQTFSSGCCICLQWFSSVFASVSYACFKCLMCLLLYVVIAASGCFKSRSGVTHGMRVESGRGRGRCLGWRGPAIGALARKPGALGCSLAHCVGTVRCYHPGSDVWALASLCFLRELKRI